MKQLICTQWMRRGSAGAGQGWRSLRWIRWTGSIWIGCPCKQFHCTNPVCGSRSIQNRGWSVFVWNWRQIRTNESRGRHTRYCKTGL